MAPTFVFRPLAASDLPLLAEWLARPHVAERWGAPADAEGIAREYGDAIASDVVGTRRPGSVGSLRSRRPTARPFSW
jgi:hypothetical protein